MLLHEGVGVEGGDVGVTGEFLIDAFHGVGVCLVEMVTGLGGVGGVAGEHGVD